MEKEKIDVSLIMAVQSGNEEAFNQLYEQYYRLVYFIAYEMCHNDADAKDILQETFVQVEKSITTLKEPENFKPWLNRIVINKCKNLFRSRKSVEMDHDDLWYQHHVLEKRSYMLPEENLHHLNDQQIIHNLMGQLNPSQREVLILRYFEHMSMKEIADMLEIPEGTVKTRLLYGKNHLRDLVLEYEQENEIKLNFYAEDGVLAALFAYWYRQMSLPKVPMVTHKQSDSHLQNGWNWIIASLCAVIIGCGIMMAQEFQSGNTPSSTQATQTAVRDVQARELYFQLMDWACCRDDMKIKSKEDFESVMPLYRKMVSTPSVYLERLKADQWIKNFEEIYRQF